MKHLKIHLAVPDSKVKHVKAALENFEVRIPRTLQQKRHTGAFFIVRSLAVKD